jgi:hypothetical protein
MEEFVLGIPPRLEKGVEKYKPARGATNIYKRDLRKNAVGYSIDDDTLEIPGFESTVEHRYLFFPKTDKSISFSISGSPGLFLVALDPDKYGFPENEYIKIKPKPLELKLSSTSKQEYSSLLHSKEIPANELFEKVGAIVNNSMKYSFDNLRRDFEESQVNYRFADVEKNSGYKSKGDEVEEGYCSDAGKKIRAVLGHMNMDKDYHFTRVVFRKDNREHDATLVFNKTSGDWAIINSKSPTKPYNLVPKEKLSELGKNIGV